MKKRKAFLPLLSLVIISSLASCGSSALSSTHKINFYDGSTLLGYVEGAMTSELSETDKTKVDGYTSKTVDSLTYTFDGWYSSYEFTGSRTTVKYYPTTDLNLYGKYLANVSITLKEGDTVVKTYTGLQGDPVTDKDSENNVVLATFPSPSSTMENATFEGWAYKDGDTYTVFDPSKDKFPSENLVLSPYYTAWPVLTFVAEDDSTFSQTLTVEPDKEITFTDAFKTTISTMISGVENSSSGNKEFDAWYSTYDTTTGKYSGAFDFSSGTSLNLTLHARFKTKHTFKIESDLTGYDFDSSTAHLFEGDLLTVPVIDSTKLGEHYFDGFYTDNTYANDKVYSFKEDGTMPDSDLTLYAHFIENPTVTVTDTHNGTNSSSFKAEPGTKVDLTSREHDYSSEHYHLLAFSTSDDSTATASYISSPKEYVVPSTATTIYAHYEMDSKISIEYIDPYGTTITGTAIDLYAENGTVLESTDLPVIADLLDTGKGNIGTAYTGSKITCFTASKTSIRAINLPYTVSEDTTLYAVVAKPITLHFEIDYYVNTNDASYTSLGTVNISSFQNETIDIGTGATDLSGGASSIKIYGTTKDTGVTGFCTKYVFYKAYQGTSEISLPKGSMPSAGLGTASDPIHIVFIPVEVQS